MPGVGDAGAMGQFDQPDRQSIMDQLQKAGLLDFPELEDFKVKREVGAGSVPAPKDGMAPMISSVPQADR
jgi:hypothetical protein